MEITMELLKLDIGILNFKTDKKMTEGWGGGGRGGGEKVKKTEKRGGGSKVNFWSDVIYECPLTETINTILLYDPSEDYTGG